MRVLIFEDEKHTAILLTNLLKEIDDSIEVVGVIGSVGDGVKWYKENLMPDLVFQDIILTDGNCFDIFETIEVSAPVIFTTAFSDYAIQSFRVNSIDYIVKPYDINDIRSAMKKLESFKDTFLLPESNLLKEVITNNKPTPRKRFLVKIGDNYSTINSSDIAYIISEDSLTIITLFDEKKYIVDYTITDLSDQMDRCCFFQINRKIIINIHSVKKISSWFNSRLKVEINPRMDEEIIVSRERVRSFKEWLDS